MILVNLTPHEVVVYGRDRSVALRLPPSGRVARVAEAREARPPLYDESGVEVPYDEVAYGPVEGLPDPVPGTVYVVSAIVRERATVRVPAVARPVALDVTRYDVVSPGAPVRDSEGRIVGCVGLTGCAGSYRALAVQTGAR